jgi:DNA-binding transcriptional LysR family regulator
MISVHDLSQVDLNLLVVLETLLDTRSTTIAARRLGRTQSAVSHALARLRDMFGDPLLVRAGSQLRPTARAEALRAPLRDVLLGARAVIAARDLEFTPRTLARTFVLGCADYAEIVLLPYMLPVLRAQAPGVDLVTRSYGDDLERATQAREIDLAYGAHTRSLSGVVVEPIRHTELVTLMRRKHPVTRQRTYGARDFAALDHILVTPRGLPGSPVDDALARLRLTRRILWRTPHFAAAVAAAAATDLVVTLPAPFAAAARASLALVTRTLPFTVPGFVFTMSYSAAFAHDPAHRWFRGLVADAHTRRAVSRSDMLAA